jgi:hypothetical protein
MLKTPALFFLSVFFWKVKSCKSALYKRSSIPKFIYIEFYIVKIQFLVDSDMVAGTYNSSVYSYAS